MPLALRPKPEEIMREMAGVETYPYPSPAQFSKFKPYQRFDSELPARSAAGGR
jgi:hypothetical protein